MRGEKVINNDDKRETQDEFRFRFRLRKLQKKSWRAWLRIFCRVFFFWDPTPAVHGWRLETLQFAVNFGLEESVFVAFVFPILNGMPFILFFE